MSDSKKDDAHEETTDDDETVLLDLHGRPLDVGHVPEADPEPAGRSAREEQFSDDPKLGDDGWGAIGPPPPSSRTDDHVIEIDPPAAGGVPATPPPPPPLAPPTWTDRMMDRWGGLLAAFGALILLIVMTLIVLDGLPETASRAAVMLTGADDQSSEVAEPVYNPPTVQAVQACNEDGSYTNDAYLEVTARTEPVHVRLFGTDADGDVVNDEHNLVLVDEYDPETGKLIQQGVTQHIPVDYKPGTDLSYVVTDGTTIIPRTFHPTNDCPATTYDVQILEQGVSTTQGAGTPGTVKADEGSYAVEVYADGSRGKRQAFGSKDVVVSANGPCGTVEVFNPADEFVGFAVVSDPVYCHLHQQGAMDGKGAVPEMGSSETTMQPSEAFSPRCVIIEDDPDVGLLAHKDTDVSPLNLVVDPDKDVIINVELSDGSQPSGGWVVHINGVLQSQQAGSELQLENYLFPKLNDRGDGGMPDSIEVIPVTNAGGKGGGSSSCYAQVYDQYEYGS